MRVCTWHPPRWCRNHQLGGLGSMWFFQVSAGNSDPNQSMSKSICHKMSQECWPPLEFLFLLILLWWWTILAVCPHILAADRERWARWQMLSHIFSRFLIRYQEFQCWVWTCLKPMIFVSLLSIGLGIVLRRFGFVRELHAGHPSTWFMYSTFTSAVLRYGTIDAVDAVANATPSIKLQIFNESQFSVAGLRPKVKGAIRCSMLPQKDSSGIGLSSASVAKKNLRQIWGGLLFSWRWNLWSRFYHPLQDNDRFWE